MIQKTLIPLSPGWMKRIVFGLAMGCLVMVQSYAMKFVHKPYLQNITDTEATFVWETDKESVGWVEIAPDDGSHYYTLQRPQYYDTRIGIKQTACLHSVKVEGLKPGVTYRYRVYSREVLAHEGFRVRYGDALAVDVFNKAAPTFTTLDKTKAETSFAILNDIHQHSEMIEPLLKLADYGNKDVIMFNGDMVSIENCADDFFKGFMDEAIRLFANKKSPYYIRGNHETRGEFAVHFQEYFNPRQSRLYYTLRQGPVFFIFLDTGEDKPDNDIEYSGIVDYDNYRTEQAEWLKTVKDDPDFQSACFRVVVAHMPTRKILNDWHGPQDCLKKFTPVLNGMDIDVMLCGHLHKDEYWEPNETVNYPVMVNSNNGVVSAATKGNELNVKVIRKEGKVVYDKIFKARRS